MPSWTAKQMFCQMYRMYHEKTSVILLQATTLKGTHLAHLKWHFYNFLGCIKWKDWADQWQFGPFFC